MNTNTFPSLLRQPALLLAGASLLVLSNAFAATDKAKEPAYENYIDVSVGHNAQTGDSANFQKALQQPKNGFGGIDDLFVTKQLNDTTNLTLRGHALVGEADYLLDLNITKDELGYVKFGYKSFRTWYDGSGGYFPRTATLISLYDEELHVDRSNLWFETGYNKPGAMNFVFRYDLLTRKGKKDSTSWFDTGLPLGASLTRYIVPTFLSFDETRHILNATLSQSLDKSDWALGLRYDQGDYTNGRYERRRPTESVDRYVTNKEGQDYNMFQMRGSYVSQITEQIKVTTAVSRTKIDTDLSGSRIVGTSYDADYSATFASRQQRDEGFFGLTGNELGDSQMTQTIATISSLYQPTETLRIVPAFRFEKTEWDNHVEFEETNFGAAPTFAPINDEVEAESEKSWKTYAGSLEGRYTGVKNLALNLKADWSRSKGDLSELRLLEPGTALQAISIDRDTELERTTQKYAATANWYVRPGTTIAAQYYYKVRMNDYDAVRDNTTTTADRYPAYVADQDFETNDFNVRLSWRLSPALRTITRYDYQATTVRSQEIGLAMAESMNSKQHIVSETVSWNPIPAWYLQANVNLVWDTMVTPATKLTGAAAGLVPHSDANYTNYGLSSGYALDDQSDLLLDYTRYQSRDSYVNNSALTVPYGSDSKSQLFSVAWNRRLDRRTTVTVKYSYATNDDATYNGKADYKANLLYAKVQYRF